LNGQIVVKSANAGDKFTTLDDVERTLGADQMMITNGTDHLCIAGVFGGNTSGISDSTCSSVFDVMCPPSDTSDDLASIPNFCSGKSSDIDSSLKAKHNPDKAIYANIR
jgi:hypothetical protein